MAQDSAKSAATVCDPVTLQIGRGALRAIQGEMEAVIERTAMSPFIREKKDFYAALFDGAGRLIVGSNLPLSGDVVGPIVEHYPLPTCGRATSTGFQRLLRLQGGSLALTRPGIRGPVFAEGKLAAFAQSWAHFNDIGGMRAGSLSPDCTEIFQEGIIVPPVRVAREGVIVEELLRLFYRNSRFPEM
jgi:N-methylhydantoinase B